MECIESESFIDDLIGLSCWVTLMKSTSPKASWSQKKRIALFAPQFA
jgi:hypothetical protein